MGRLLASLATIMVLAATAVGSSLAADVCNQTSFQSRPIPTGGPFAASGDSGSLVVTDETCPRAVGLLFAGGVGATFANPISAVLSRLSKKMVGGCTATTGAVEPLTEEDTLVVAGGGSAGENVASEQAAVNAANAVKARHDNDLMAIPGVVGTGIGRSAKTGQIVIKVYLEKDLATARAATPTEIDGVPVEVEVTGPIVAY